MEEQELIIDKLADIRDNLFDDMDFVSDEGYDILPELVASPYEVVCNIERKLLRQQKGLEDWKELFYLLKKDYELLENFKTDEWQ